MANAPPFKRCTICATPYSRYGWMRLPFVGYHCTPADEEGPEEHLELRNCPCNATLSVDFGPFHERCELARRDPARRRSSGGPRNELRRGWYHPEYGPYDPALYVRCLQLIAERERREGFVQEPGPVVPRRGHPRPQAPATRAKGRGRETPTREKRTAMKKTTRAHASSTLAATRPVLGGASNIFEFAEEDAAQLFADVLAHRGYPIAHAPRTRTVAVGAPVRPEDLAAADEYAYRFGTVRGRAGVRPRLHDEVR